MWFLPANLLQTAFGNASAYPPDATLMGEVFGGGIVRIESTNCSHLTGPAGADFPGELIEHTEGQLRDVLDAVNSKRSDRRMGSLEVMLVGRPLAAPTLAESR